jgi:shikimate dehydrogenase
MSAVVPAPDEGADGLPLPLTGRTALYGILGDPIAQVASPRLLNTAFRRRGWPAVLVPFHVEAAGLAETLKGLRLVRNLKGLVLTTPHKTAALAMLDSLGPEARLVRAVNAIRCAPRGRWHGENFDGVGCLTGLGAAGHVVTARRVLVVGTGGAGRAVAAAVARVGPALLRLHDIDADTAGAVARDLRAAFPGLAVDVGEPDPRDFDVAINCTPLGMAASPGMAFDPAPMRRGSLVVDLVVEPRMTALLQAAAARGCSVHQGHLTVAGQVDAICRFFAEENHA